MESRVILRSVAGILRCRSRGLFTARELRQIGGAAASPQQPVNFGGDGVRPHPNPRAKQTQQDGQQQQQQQPAEGEAKTIGDAFEETARRAANKPLETKDVRTIQSAEARATGAAAGVLGGPAQFASNLKEGRGPGQNVDNPTLGDALKDAKEYMPFDKVVTPQDAARVEQAEQRNDPLGRVDPAGVAAAVRDAAEHNVSHGYVSGGASGASGNPNLDSRLPGAGRS